MNCLVVGAAGFIGRHLMRHLADCGDVGRGFDLTSEGGDACTRCDVMRDPIPIPAGTDVVYYLAQSPHYRSFPSGGDELFGVNAIGALRVATAAADAGVRVFVFASTGNVYTPGFEPMTERRPRRRDDAYALSKIMGEDLVGLLNDRLVVTPVRLFGVFGPGQTTMLVPAIGGRVERGEPVTLEPHPNTAGDTDGLTISLTFVDDAVACLRGLAAAGLEGADAAGPVNLAGPEPISVRHLATAIGDALGRPPRFEIAASPRATDYIADIARLQTLLAPRFTPFAAAIRRTVADG